MLKLSVFYLAVRVLNGLFSVAALYLLTRLLTAEEYGRYVLVTAAATLVAVAGFQWINVAVSRFHAQFKDREGSILAEALALYLWVALPILIAVVMSVIAGSIFDEIRISIVLISAIAAFALAAHSLGLQVANARQTPGLYGAITFARGGFGIVLAWFLIKEGYSWQGAVVGFSAAAAFSVIFLAPSLRSAQFEKNSTIRLEMIRYGLPLSLTFLASIVLELAGRFIIGAALGEASVGGYAAGYDLAQQLIGATMNAFFLAVFPAIVRAYEEGGVNFAAEKMRRLFEYLFFISPFVLGVFYGLSPQIASVVFGPPFRDSSAQVMPWIATAVWIFGFKSYYLDVVFQLKKKTKIQLYTTALMAVISILSTYFFVMHDGIRGAAIAAVVSFTIGALTSYAYGRSEGLYTIGLSDVVGLVVAVGLVSFAARVGVATAQGTEFVALITGCAFAFAASVVAACALDVAGCRTAALTFLRRRK